MSVIPPKCWNWFYSQADLQFSDGFAYSKGKMDEAFRSGLFDKQATKSTKEIVLAKREDVDLIVATTLLFAVARHPHAQHSGTRA
jgi:hypothetical protein